MAKVKHFIGGVELDHEPVEYRLGSAPLVHTPGILAWAINGYKFKKDRKNLLRVFTEGYGGTDQSPTPEQFDRLLKGEIPYRVEDDTVIFSA